MARAERHWYPLGEGLGGLPIGFIAGEFYTQQSIRIERGDILLIFSDGATDVFSPHDQFLGAEGFLQLANQTMTCSSRMFLSTLLRKLSSARSVESTHDSANKNAR